MKKIISKFIPSSKKPGAEGVSGQIPAFDRPFYADITEARLRHFKSLGLPVSGKKVLDLGCGIGRFSEYFAEQGCEVLCVDGRQDNIEKLKELYPGRKAAVVDLETPGILNYGDFDIVFCYGLLYHLADPFGLIKNAAKICKEIMIIETCITDAIDPVLRLVDEPQSDVTQAVCGVGCRPSPAYVIRCLKLAGFEFIYSPVELPDHEQFRYKKSNDFSHQKKNTLIRDIFIASRRKIESGKLRRHA